jgi:hypothetical protein
MHVVHPMATAALCYSCHPSCMAGQVGIHPVYHASLAPCGGTTLHLISPRWLEGMQVLALSRTSLSPFPWCPLLLFTSPVLCRPCPLLYPPPLWSYVGLMGWCLYPELLSASDYCLQLCLPAPPPHFFLPVSELITFALLGPRLTSSFDWYGHISPIYAQLPVIPRETLKATAGSGLLGNVKDCPSLQQQEQPQHKRACQNPTPLLRPKKSHVE